MRFFQRYSGLFSKEGNGVAIIIAAIAFLTWTFLLLKKYYYFGYCDWDLAFFSQCMFGILRGNAFSSLFENNLLGNHSNIIAYVISPLFAIFPHPMTLVIFKVLSYVFTGFFLYLLAVSRIGKPQALLVMLLYYLYLPNVFGLLHDFDFESLSPIFLVLLIMFYYRMQWRNFILTALLAVIVKENIPLMVAAFGIMGLFSNRDKLRWGVVPFLLGAISFIYFVKFLVPSMALTKTGGAHPYTYIYKGIWEGGLWGAAQYCISMFFSSANINFIIQILSVLLFAPILSASALFPIIPLILQHALSSAPTHHSIRYYYVMPMAPFLFFALILFVERWRGGLRRTIWVGLIGLLVCAYSLQWQEYWPIVSSSFNCNCCGVPDRLEVTRKWRMIESIPNDAAVIASFDFLTQLSVRPELYALYKLYFPGYQLKGSAWRMPKNVQYALINLNDPWLLPFAPLDFTERYEFVLNLLGGKDAWDLLERSGESVLLKKKLLSNGISL